MAAKPKLSSNLITLRQDANKVIDDIQRLSADLKSVSKDRADDAYDSLIDTLEARVDGLKTRASEVADTVQGYAQEVDKKVTANPYPFLFGATGVGFLIGRLMHNRSCERA